mgnify:CR=1 FL=1
MTHVIILTAVETPILECEITGQETPLTIEEYNKVSHELTVMQQRYQHLQRAHEEAMEQHENAYKALREKHEDLKHQLEAVKTLFVLQGHVLEQRENLIKVLKQQLTLAKEAA